MPVGFDSLPHAANAAGSFVSAFAPDSFFMIHSPLVTVLLSIDIL
jgi:hypothetical protein